MKASNALLRRTIGLVLFLVVAVSAMLSLYFVIITLDRQPRTTDASIMADLARVSAGIPGRITTIAVRENQQVKSGDLLFELDARALELLRDQAQAQVDAARAALADSVRAASATAKNAQSANAQIERAQTNLDLAEATVARLEPLAADGIASQQSLDEARALAADARVSLEVARETAGAADDLVSDTVVLEAGVRVAEAALALAEHNLSMTKVNAPFDGVVTGLDAAIGAWVLPEAPVFNLIDTQSWRAEGFFRETDLAAIQPGQPVSISVLSNPGTVIRGHVESVGRGVLGTDAFTLPGQLPFVAETTNWVRLAKRYPVLVALEGPLPDDLRLGGSATLVVLPPDIQ